MPHSQTPAPLKFSFGLKNPSAPQAPQLAFVLVGGISESYGGKSRRLVCQTSAGCTGVLAATQPPSFASLQVLEKTKYAAHVNTFSFFLQANVPLQRGDTEITITSLPISVPPGGLQLTRSAGTSRRVERCVGINTCVLRQDQNPVPGTISTRYYTDMTVACTNEDVASKTFGQEIENLEIHAVHICGQLMTNVRYKSPCSKVVKHWAVLTDLDVAACQGDDDMLVRIEGLGFINMTSTLNVDYVFDVSSRLALVNQALVLTVVTNLSDHSTATQNMLQIAFSFNSTNPTVRRFSSKPIVAASLPAGVVLKGTQANPTGWGVGGSGINYCSGVEVISDNTKTSLPFENVGVETGNKKLGVYHEITHDGVAECIFVVQPHNPKQWLLRFSFDQYDVNEATEMVEMFNGDSPASPRMGILYRQTGAFSLDSRYFLANKDMFVDDCVITFRLLARRRVAAGKQELLGYAKGRLGFALSFKLVDPTKMDHFKAELGFNDMVDSVEDVSVQLKLRKVFASVLDIMYPSVVFEGASAARRTTLLVDFTSHRRAGTSSAAIRVLCTSPDATTQQADAFGSALNANLVTSAMNDAGIPGSALLAAPIQVFRCGKELECVPWVIPPEIIITTPPPPPPPPAVPFPIIPVVQLALGIILGPAIVGICVLCLFFHFKKKMSADVAAKKQMAIEAFKGWMEDKTAELEASDAHSLGKLAEKHELVQDGEWKEEEIKDMIPEMAKYFYRIEIGLGVKPEGIYRYVPTEMYQDPAKLKGMKKKPEKVVKQVKEETAEVSGELAFQEGDENENPEGATKKKSQKRTEARDEHKILWIKRASDSKPETQEEVAV
jgi:hypothetical protein